MTPAVSIAPPDRPAARRITGLFSHAPDRRNVITTTLATLLLALFWWLAVSAAIDRSPTSDEVPHIASGHAYDLFGDFRLHPENGVLPQRLFGLPGILDGARFPIGDEQWRTGRYWSIGWDYLYGLNNNTDWIVFAARALNAIFGVALGGLTFVIARAWHGRAGGLLALAFFVFSPNLLFHSALATSDIIAALTLLLAPCCFWWHLRRRDPGSALVAGGVSGLALVAKFNGVLLVPIYLVLVAADIWLRSAAGSRWRRGIENAGLGAGQAVLAAAVVWCCYNFRFAASGPELQFSWNLDDMLAGIGWKRAIIEPLLEWKLLPQAWLYGLSHVLAGAELRPAFFAGEYSDRGWWNFFPAIVLAKTPLGALGAIALAAGVVGFATLRASPAVRRTWAERVMPLIVAPAVVWTAAMASNLNIGDRHVIAVYPPLYILAGALVRPVWLRWIGGGLLIAHAHASFAIRPYYLASFNQLVGGPSNGYRLFVDSGLDWGQDLPALQQWLAAHRRPGEKFYLAYFGTAWPPYHGVRPTHFLPMTTYLARPPLVPYQLEPGLYCISATALSEVFSSQRGAWTDKNEEDYRAVHERLRDASRANEAIPPADYARYDLLRFSRLCKYLQRREPDGHAGYSILVFRLSAEELRVALEGTVVFRYGMKPGRQP